MLKEIREYVLWVERYFLIGEIRGIFLEDMVFGLGFKEWRGVFYVEMREKSILCESISIGSGKLGGGGVYIRSGLVRLEGGVNKRVRREVG